jgi:hypothetical protein
MDNQYIDVYGLHGTSKEQAENIEIGGFDLSKDGYYGQGVYFYEDNNKGMKYAVRWASRKFHVIGVVRANLFCSSDLYIDLAHPEYGLKDWIIKLSKNKSSDDTSFNIAVKRLFKNFLYEIEQETGIHCSLVKVFVPEGAHHGWDYGYVAKDKKIIKSQKMLDTL